MMNRLFLLFRRKQRILYALLLSAVIAFPAYSQVTAQQADRLNDAIRSNFVKLLFEEETGDFSRVFLLKLDIAADASLAEMVLSDNVDSLFKEAFLSAFYTPALAKKIKQLGLPAQQIIIPVHYIYNLESAEHKGAVLPAYKKPVFMTSFGGIPFEGACVWLPPIEFSRSFRKK